MNNKSLQKDPQSVPTSVVDGTALSYWHWFHKGTGGRPGWLRLIDRWFGLHLIIGGVLSWAIPKSLEVAAGSILLPLAGVLVGLAFAWAGNAQALLQTDEITKLANKVPGGLREYAFTYQTAILSLLTTITLWGLAGLGLFDSTHPLFTIPRFLYWAMGTLLYSLSSFSLRECWHVVVGAQIMLLIRSDLKQIEENETERETSV
jgi:hypothetical protein